jgi:hypothetical protein
MNGLLVYHTISITLFLPLMNFALISKLAGYYEGDFFYVNWDIDLPQFKNYHINIKETMAIVLSVIRWGHIWTNKSVVVFTENMTTKCIINKGSS